MTVPFCGFSFAVSGKTIPPAVLLSASTRWSSTLSDKGLIFILFAPDSLSV
jgi:hypothetical protein